MILWKTCWQDDVSVPLIPVCPNSRPIVSRGTAHKQTASRLENSLQRPPTPSLRTWNRTASSAPQTNKDSSCSWSNGTAFSSFLLPHPRLSQAQAQGFEIATTLVAYAPEIVSVRPQNVLRSICASAINNCYVATFFKFLIKTLANYPTAQYVPVVSWYTDRSNILSNVT